jgi:hypothetical protein
MKIADACVCCGSRDLGSNQAVLAPFVATRVFGWRPVEITADWGLRDLRQGWSYAPCNTLECRDCGHVFLDMRFDDHEMARLYSGYRGPDYTDLREEFEPGYRERNARLVDEDAYVGDVEAFLRPLTPAKPKLLDWGGDTGLNTPFRREAALHHIYDISDKPPIAGAVHVTKAQLEGVRYDLIVCSNVLEHIPHPAAALQELCAIADREQLIYIEVPFEDLMRSRALEGEARPKRLWHEHINFFSERSLRAVVERGGFRVVKTAVLEYSRPERVWRAFAAAIRRA